ncbi:MAG: hypothetical protein R6V58_05185 [Planctomycetota bacterium]
MNSFQKQCIDYLAEFVEQNVLADDAGHVTKITREQAPFRGGQAPNVTLAMALVADPDWGDHAEADRIRSFAADLVDDWHRAQLRFIDDGDVVYSFLIICLAPACRRLLPHISKSRRRKWLTNIRTVAEAAGRFLLQKQAAWGKPGPWTGCGPNHLFLTAASLYRMGDLLGEDRFRRLARRAMHKLIGLQADAGYFPESVGPVVGYQQLSLFGVCDYYAASGDETVRPAAEKGIDFLVRAHYPDLTPIKALDQRQRSHRRPGQLGGGGGRYALSFTVTPEGRRFAQIMLDRYTRRVPEQDGYGPYFAAGLAAIGALNHPGGRGVKQLRCERPTRIERFDGKAGIIQRDGWCVTLVGYHDSRRPGNPYVLDRSQNVAVFHEDCGLVIGGGNDKHHFESATFEILESGTCYYFPTIDERARISPKRGVLDLDFGAAQARLVAEIRSRKTVELVAGLVTNLGDQRNRFNLQIPVGPGAKIRIDGDDVRLRKRKTEKVWPVAESLELPGLVAIDVPCESQFCWPHLPWNPYNAPTYESTIDAAVGFLRIPLGGRDIAERKVVVRRLG